MSVIIKRQGFWGGWGGLQFGLFMVVIFKKKLGARISCFNFENEEQVLRPIKTNCFMNLNSKLFYVDLSSFYGLFVDKLVDAWYNVSS